MPFGYWLCMHTRAAIENIIIQELHELCTTCRHSGSCSYYQKTDKAIIQCELYEAGEHNLTKDLTGLCKNCDNARYCSLPGKRLGVWHCDEYK